MGVVFLVVNLRQIHFQERLSVFLCHFIDSSSRLAVKTTERFRSALTMQIAEVDMQNLFCTLGIKYELQPLRSSVAGFHARECIFFFFFFPLLFLHFIFGTWAARIVQYTGVTLQQYETFTLYPHVSCLTHTLTFYFVYQDIT
jgi:hypothetical protein